MEDKICVLTEASDAQIHLTRVSLFTFIEKNKWFDGVVYLAHHKNDSLSQKSIDGLTSIYSNLEEIEIDNFDINGKKSNFSSEVNSALVKTLAFTLSAKRIFYFANTSVFLKDLSFMLKPNRIYGSSIGPNLFYSSDQNENDFTNKLSTEFAQMKIISESNINCAVHSALRKMSTYLEFSHSFYHSYLFEDKKFNQNKVKLSEAVYLDFSKTIYTNSKSFLKINSIWTQKNLVVTKLLSNPMSATFKSKIRHSKFINQKLHTLEKDSYISPKEAKDKIDGISVLIPAYRAEKYIESCLDSITSTTLNFEIIVGVDNCVSTLHILTKIKSKYPNLRIFNSKQNVGPYVLKNSLVQHAKFSNYLFFDADDIAKPELLDTVANFYNENFPIRFKYTDFNDGSNPATSTSHHPSVAHGVFFISKKIFTQVGGFQAWPCGADTEFIKRCAANRILSIKIESRLFYRRIHPTSLTQSSSTNHTSSIRKIVRNRIKTTKDWSIPITPRITSLEEIK